MKNRSQLPLFVICILFLVAVSCNSDEGINENRLNSNSEKALPLSKLRIMGHWLGEGKKELMVREAVREFSLHNQSLDVKLQFPQEIFKYKDESELYLIEVDSIAKMARKNEWPFDIMLLDQERYKRVAEALNDPNWGTTYLVDFSQKPWFEAAHKENFFKTIDYKTRYGGILPGPFLEGISFILFASEEVEKKLGIQVKDKDMNFSDFTQYAKSVYDYNQTNQNKITFFSTQLRNGQSLLFSHVVMSMVGQNENLSRKEALDIVDKAYQLMERLSKYVPVKQTMDFSGLLSDTATVLNGKARRFLFNEICLFNLQPSWLYLLWKGANPKGAAQMKPCELPSADGFKSLNYPGYYQVIFVVPKNARNKEAAEHFLQFLSSSDTADKWIKYSSCPTGLKNNISYTDFGMSKFDIFFRHIQTKYGTNQREIDLSKLLFKSNKPINFRENEVLSGQLSSKEALKNVMRQL